MRTRVAAFSLAGSLAAFTVFAQAPTPGRGPTVAGASAPASLGALSAIDSAKAAAPLDSKVYPSSTTLPEPATPDQLQPATCELPHEAIEPYLLTKEAGPFMVMAKAFRGPEADRYALALCLELRRDYQLPAYILRSKEFPGRSNIRNVPPTAPPAQDRGAVNFPERVRTYDEAVVLVGNEKTEKGSEVLLHKVKSIDPECLKGMPSMYVWRKGLKTALRTTNPYVPAQDLFAGKRDSFVAGLNKGPRSIYNCPGRYTLQVIEFTGRSTFNVAAAKLGGDRVLKQSPLYTAHDDAEKLANALGSAEEVKRLGQPVYVYHDRTSSRVMIGSFESPNDPRAIRVRQELLYMASSIMDKKRFNDQPARTRGIDKMIAPASYLTDLETIKPH
jgi:hypothetical protein